MTTAHRPTWKAAVGQASGGGWTAGGAASGGVSVLDLNAHTKLKVRKGAQIVDRQQALKESLKKLEQAEAHQPLIGKRRPVSQQLEEEGRLKLLKQTAEVDDSILKNYDDDDAEDENSNNSGDDGGGWKDVGNSDDDLDASSSEDDDNDDSGDDDDDDDEEALQAELAKIRAEREAVKRRKEEEEAAVEESKQEEAALLGNPLLAGTAEADAKLKRKWNDDVVFRNQAKGEPAIKKRFINDTVRNDFHKRFLNKFIR